MKRIASIAELVSSLGGEAGVADILLCPKAQVRRWLDQGYIQTGWHLRLYLAAEDRGYRVDRAVFELF